MKTEKCTRCAGEKIATITMSEANWERIELRHAQQKKFLLTVALVATASLLISNIFWFILGTNNQFKSYENVEESGYENVEKSYQQK